MDELRQAVIKLQEKFKKLALSDESIRGVVKCNSDNLENLKTFTLEVHDRVKAIEDALKGKNGSIDLIDEKVERIKIEMENLDKRLETADDKHSEDIESTNARIKENFLSFNVKQLQESRLLKELINENEIKLQEVESNLLKQEVILKQNEPVFKCGECGNSFVKRIERRTHINENHPKQFSCDGCDLTFCESWRYEMHLETHSNKKDHKCEVCGKEFYMEWRFKQHVKVHANSNVKKCHYYSNNKVCPYEPIGCKFKHEMSENCSKQTTCRIKLCSKQHPRI